MKPRTRMMMMMTMRIMKKTRMGMRTIRTMKPIIIGVLYIPMVMTTL